MSWKPLVAAGSSKAPTKSGIRCGLRKNRPTAPARLMLTISVEVAERLGWGVKTMLAAEFGEHEHAGWLRFRGEQSSGRYPIVQQRTHGGKSFLRVDIGIIGGLPDISAPMVDVEWERDTEGWVSFALPTWRSTPSELPRPAVACRPAAMPPSSSPAARPPGVSGLVGRMMGDPAPGRSALDQRSAK